eukprot:3818386-Rhodomonas_salina.5
MHCSAVTWADSELGHDQEFGVDGCAASDNAAPQGARHDGGRAGEPPRFTSRAREAEHRRRQCAHCSIPRRSAQVQQRPLLFHGTIPLLGQVRISGVPLLHPASMTTSNPCRVLASAPMIAVLSLHRAA